MLRLLLFISLSFAGILAFPSQIDSLLQQAEKQSGEAKVNTLINISRQYFIDEDILAIKYADEAIKLSDSLGFIEGRGKAMLFMGLAWADIEPDTALKYYLESSDILTRLDNPWAFYGYKNAADLYVNKGWFPEALNCVFKVFDINQKTGDTLQMIESMSSLGFLYNSIGDLEDAMIWQRKALDLMADLQNDTRLGLILGRIGILFDEMGIYDSALHYNNLAVEYFRKAGMDVYVAQWLSNIANTQIKLGNFSKAEELLLEARQLNMYDDRKPNIYCNLSKVYTETGRFHAAEDALDTAFLYSARFQMNEVRAEAWFRLYELNSARGNIKGALDAYIRYSTLMDSILNEKKTGQMAQMLVRYETENKEKALLFEKAEKDRIEKEKISAQLAASRRQKWIWGVSFLASVVVIIILILLFRIRRKAQNEKNLAIIQEQEKSLVAIINAQDEERKRVATDLHDGVGQQISAVSLNFQVLARRIAKENPDLVSNIEKIKRMIMDTSQEIRSVSHQMMPRALTHFGLVDALEDMIEASFKNSGIKYSFKHQNMDERLPQEVEIGIYRIAQELINNITRHSKAKHVDIQLYRTGSHAYLTVRDDGIGIDASKSKGIGLTNITSRVNVMKGGFILDSQPGNGTSATVKVRL